MLNNDLSWSNKSYNIIYKLNSRLYCLRKLKKFNVNTCILIFLITNRITGIIKKSGSIMRSNERSHFCVYYKNAILRKLQAILRDQNHALHPEFHKHIIARSSRMRIPACSTNRYLKSFVPEAISLFNSVIACGTVIISY